MRPCAILAVAVLALAIGIIAQAPTSWINIPYADLPGSYGPQRLFFHQRIYITNCSLPCNSAENRVWTGQYLDYLPCVPDPNNSTNVCRVTAGEIYWPGRQSFLDAHPDLANASYYLDKNGNRLDSGDLVQWGSPKVYSAIASDGSIAPLFDPEHHENPATVGEYYFFTGDYDTGNMEYLPQCIHAVSHGHICGTVAYCNQDYSLGTTNGTPQQQSLMQGRIWDIIQIANWVEQQTTGPFVGRLSFRRILSGHSLGGLAAGVVQSTLASLRFLAQTLDNVVALILYDPSFWAMYAKEIHQITVPTLILGSSELDPIMGNRRGLGLIGTKDVYVVVHYNSAHQNKEYGAMAAGMQSKAHGLNHSGDAFSWSGDLVPGSFNFPTAVAEEDFTGTKFPSDSVIQAPFLSQYEVDMHFQAAFVRLYLNQDPSAQADLTFERAQRFLRNRGEFWAHFSCGNQMWNSANLVNNVNRLLGLLDTYEPNNVFGPTGFITLGLQSEILDGEFTFSDQQQTAAELERCLRQQGRTEDAAHVRQRQLILNSVPEPKKPLGKRLHGLSKRLPSPDITVVIERLQTTLKRMLRM